MKLTKRIRQTIAVCVHRNSHRYEIVHMFAGYTVPRTLYNISRVTPAHEPSYCVPHRDHLFMSRIADGSALLIDRQMPGLLFDTQFCLEYVKSLIYFRFFFNIVRLPR